VVAVESSVIGEPLRHLVLEPFEGTFAELLERLNAVAGDSAKRQKTWPQSPRAMSSEVRRLAPALRALGYEIALPDGKTRGQRLLSIQNNGAGHRPDRPDRPAPDDVDDVDGVSQTYSKDEAPGPGQTR